MKKKIRRLKWSLIRPNCVRKHFWSDPTVLEPFMIRLNCARMRFWSDPIALELFMIRPKCARRGYGQTFQTKMTSDQTISRPWSDRSALELPKRPCNFGLGTHGCALDWVWSEINLGLDLNLGSKLSYYNLPAVHGFEALTSCMSVTSSSTEPPLNNF